MVDRPAQFLVFGLEHAQGQSALARLLHSREGAGFLAKPVNSRAVFRCLLATRALVRLQARAHLGRFSGQSPLVVSELHLPARSCRGEGGDDERSRGRAHPPNNLLQKPLDTGL